MRCERYLIPMFAHAANLKSRPEIPGQRFPPTRSPATGKMMDDMSHKTVFDKNVLTEISGLSSIELKDNTVIIVLGASGDLAKKKTVRSTILVL